MKKLSVLAGLFAFLIITSSLSFVSAGANPVAIRIVPAQTNWMANGVTQYRVDIYLDNTALASQQSNRTGAIDWQLVMPEGLNITSLHIVSASYNVSQPQDFFNGYDYSPAFQIVTPSWSPQHRSVSPPNGPFNRVGTVASYWFTVSPGTPLGNYNLTLTETYVYDPFAIEQSFTVESVPFKVVKPAYPLATYSRAQQCIPGVNC